MADTNDSLKPHPLGRDRYLVSREIFDRNLRGVPGVISYKPQVEYAIHRNHLPLIGHSTQISIAPLWPPATFQDGTSPRPWQQEITPFIRSRFGSYLAWSMRTGKTGASLLAHHLDYDGALIILGPKQSRSVWMNWCRRRWTDGKIGCLNGVKFDPKQLRGFDAIFLHYEIAAAWNTLSLASYIGKPVGTMILDESHLLSNAKSLRTQAVGVMSSNAARVIALSGTPIFNRVSGIHSVLSMLNPAGWGSYWDFAKRYNGAKPGTWGWTLGETTHEDELRSRLTEVVSIKSWQDVVDHVPEVTHRVVTVEMPPAKTIELTKLAETIRTGSGRRSTIGEIARMRRVLGITKAFTAASEAKDVLRSGRSVVVWVWHHDVAEKVSKELAKEFPTVFVVTGEDGSDKRDQIIDLWRGASPSPLVISIAVGQVAIDLSQSDECIFAEQDWTPATMSQAEMRTFSPSRPMSVTQIVADHVVDLQIVNALVGKCRQAQNVGLSASDNMMNFLHEALGGAPVLLDDFVGLMDFSRIGEEEEE